MRARLPWMRVVDLATQFEATRIARDEIDPMIAARVARAVLDFQEQLLGEDAKTVTQAPARHRLEPDQTTVLATASIAEQRVPPWARVVQLAQQFEALRVARREIDPVTATSLARAVLDFQDQLRSAVAKTAADSVHPEH
jgi:hypothetical protein